MALIVSGISAWWVFSCIYRDALPWQAWEKERLCCHARESDSSPWAQAFLRVAGWIFFSCWVLQFFFSGYKSLRWVYVFKKLISSVKRLMCGDTVSNILMLRVGDPQRTSWCDFHRDLFTLHGDWRCGELRCRSEGPSGYLGQCKIACWSKWKYEGDLWPWFYVNICVYVYIYTYVCIYI